MGEKASFFVLRAKAVPEVLLRVVEAKRLLDSGKVESVQEATEMVQISRSSFYKYKDDIFPYHENAKGKTVNMVIQLDDEPGLLSMVLKTIAEFHANILTIHQSVPVNGIASLSLSIDVFPATGNVEDMRNSIESVQGIHYAKICPRIAIDTLPVSSETTIVSESLTSLIPTAARCLVPRSLLSVILSDNGR